MSKAEQLEREIAQTRYRLALTLGDLRETLTPRGMAAQMGEVFSRARAGDNQRRNTALALAGAAFIWFLWRRKDARGAAALNASMPGLRVAAALLTLITSSADPRDREEPSLKPKVLPRVADDPVIAATSDLRDDDIAAVKDDARGRQADAPSEIPPRGWKDILFRIYTNISEHRIFAIGGGVTFYSILAIFPAIAALVSLYGLFADASTIAGHLDALTGVLPGGAIEVLRDQLTRVTSKGQGALGVAFGISLLTSIWSANAGMKAFFDALNIVYGEREKRGFIALNALSLAFTTGAILFLLLSLGAIVVLPAALNYFGVANGVDFLPALRWPALFLVVSLALSILYRYGPSRDKAKWRWISWGSAVATFLWLGASLLFSWYAANFGNYNATYGSLGAAIGFMVWIWLSSIVFLLGAELDAEMEHQTARDTTVGGEKLMGARGARMADAIGKPMG